MSNPEEIAKWHKWFAIECNNQAWDLSAQPVIDEGAARELLLTAYASAYHWSFAGDAKNGALADTLLAHAHSTVGELEMALKYANRALAYYTENGGADWEWAFVHLELAFALHRDKNAWAEHINRVHEFLTGMEAEDASIVRDELERVTKRIRLSSEATHR